MSKIVINSVDDFIELTGKKLGVSNWIQVNQAMINLFADATHDHQWIHVDAEKAQNDSPYKTTIAHGYLTLSLLPYLLSDIVDVRNLKQLVNYSVENMTYKAAVPANSMLRMVAYLEKAKDLGNICKTKIRCVFEVEGGDAPVLEGTIVYLYYFE